MTRPIHFHIDEVVLRGVRPEDARRVVAALERGLVDHAEALTSSGGSIPPRVEAFRRLEPVRVSSGSASELGGAVADAVALTVAKRGGRP